MEHGEIFSSYLMLTVSDVSLLALDAFLCLLTLAAGDSPGMALRGAAGGVCIVAAMGLTRRTTPSSESPLLAFESDVTMERPVIVRTSSPSRGLTATCTTSPIDVLDEPSVEVQVLQQANPHARMQGQHPVQKHRKIIQPFQQFQQVRRHYFPVLLLEKRAVSGAVLSPFG